MRIINKFLKKRNKKMKLKRSKLTAISNMKNKNKIIVNNKIINFIINNLLTLIIINNNPNMNINKI